MLSEDGANGRNHPASILAALTDTEEQEADGYDSGDEFMAAWAAVTGGDANA